MKYASVGSISHGTMREEDLLDSFADELEDLTTRNAELDLKTREGFTKIVWDARELLDIEEDDRGQVWELSASDVVQELCEALETFAPEYCYFGSHPGDGSDYGFWPCSEAIDELPRISDDATDDEGEPIDFADQAKELGEDCAFVNDHGNVTVYSATGEIILELV